MNYESLPASALDASLCAQWNAFQAADAALASPHFSLEFTRHVAAVRPRTEVIVMRRGREVFGFLPIHRSAQNVACPIADRLSDLQGAVMARNVAMDLEELVRACSLRGIMFREWLLTQEMVRPYCAVQDAVPFMELSSGFDAYCRARRAAGCAELPNLFRKARKVAREVGPLRFEPYVHDRAVFAALLAWKAAHLESRGQPSTLAEPWQEELLWRIAGDRQAAFAGMLSALYAGDELLAVTMGMRSRTVLNGWVTAYNPHFARYSPGMLLLIELARAAPELGVERIDMGRGSEAYKRAFLSGVVAIGEGAAYARRWQSRLHTARLHAREWLRASRWGAPAQLLSRRVRFALTVRRAEAASTPDAALSKALR